VRLGEYTVKGMPPAPLAFSGKNRAEAKRRALSYWYQHREKLNLSLRDFFARCRLSADERTIIFVAVTLTVAAR
jgi:hypothetical protein